MEIMAAQEHTPDWEQFHQLPCARATKDTISPITVSRRLFPPGFPSQPRVVMFTTCRQRDLQGGTIETS